MKITDFIIKWHVQLSPEGVALYSRATEIMRDSKDPTHDEKHSEALFTNIDTLLESEENLVEQINFEVLVLSVCWHDCWRSQVVPNNVFELFFTFCWDGLGSKYLFEKEAKKVGLSSPTMKATAYAIRKHHSVQILPRTTLESKILKDVDELEVWTLSRARIMYKYALKYMNGRGMRRLMRNYLQLKVANSIETVYFLTTAKLLQKKKDLFLKEFDDEIASF